MENASKALLIAGAILLVIAIIAIAVGIVSKTRGTIDVAETQITDMEIRMHNNQFTIYEGIVTGEQLKDCIATVFSNNSTSEMKVSVYVRNKDNSVKFNIEPTTPSFNSSRVGNNERYFCNTSIDTNGIVIALTFKEQ